jgi:hypothetical protein
LYYSLNIIHSINFFSFMGMRPVTSINGINFLISSSYKELSVVNKILDALAEATSGENVQRFLEPLKGKTFYITPDNAEYYNAYYAGLVNLWGNTFWTVGDDGHAHGETESAPLGSVENIAISDAILNSDNARFFATPDGKYPFDLARDLFHELAHAVTTPDGVLTENFGKDDSAYEGVEALAVAAEDLGYTTDHVGPKRVGHNPVSGDPTDISFDPTISFLGSTEIRYENVAATDGSTNGVFTADTPDNGQIQKAYGSVARGILNFVSITGIRESLVGDGTQFSNTFSSALNGMLASKDEVEMKIARAQASEKALTAGINALLEQRGVSGNAALTALSEFSFFDLNAVIGNSNERFTGAKRADYVGPVDASGASVLGFTAGRAGILVGASGYSDGVRTDDTSQTRRLDSAADKLTAFQTGSSLLIAGDGPATNPDSKYNQFHGGNDSDIFVGGSGNDEVFADYGADLVVGSAGNDHVHGNGLTVFAVDPLAVNPIVDTTGYADGKLNLVDNYDSSSRTTLEGVHIFLGNQNLRARLESHA